jgi:hypothetical protein
MSFTEEQIIAVLREHERPLKFGPEDGNAATTLVATASAIIV